MPDPTNTNPPPDTSAPATAPAVQAPAVSEPSENISDVLQFDPFAPPKAPPTTDESVADGGEDGTGGAAAPNTTTEPPAPTPAPEPKPSPLEQAIATNTDAIRAIMAAQQTQAAQQQAVQQQPAQPEQPQQPKFNLGVPDQIVAAMASEDPKERSVALHAIVNGVANHVWQQTETLVRGVVQEVLQSVPRMIEGQQQLVQRQQEVANDFYGTYEVFKRPEFVPLMQNIGMQIAHEMVAAGQQPQWNAKMRDAIAERMFVLFPMLKAQHDTKAKGNGTQPAKRQQPFATGTGARPAQEPLNEMEAVLKVW